MMPILHESCVRRLSLSVGLEALQFSVSFFAKGFCVIEGSTAVTEHKAAWSGAAGAMLLMRV